MLQCKAGGCAKQPKLVIKYTRWRSETHSPRSCRPRNAASSTRFPSVTWPAQVLRFCCVSKQAHWAGEPRRTPRIPESVAVKYASTFAGPV